MSDPVEVTLRYATTVEDLAAAWAFVMERLDGCGPAPSIKISPLWSSEDGFRRVRFSVVVSGDERRNRGRGRHTMTPSAETDAPVCKHCGLPIITDPDGPYAVGTHAEGIQRGLYRCAVEPYGFNAEPVGMECGRTCRGDYEGGDPSRVLLPTPSATEGDTP